MTRTCLRVGNDRLITDLRNGRGEGTVEDLDSVIKEKVTRSRSPLPRVNFDKDVFVSPSPVVVRSRHDMGKTVNLPYRSGRGPEKQEF